MRRIYRFAFKLIILLLLISTSIMFSRNINLSNVRAQIFSNNNSIITKEPTEQIYRELFITMLYPYVEKATADYYDEYTTYIHGEDPWSYKFISIEKSPGLNYSYTVVLEIQPYVGPHLSVGRDRITFKIDLDGVKVEKFEHIKSYELPPNYQHIIKKKLPNT